MMHKFFTVLLVCLSINIIANNNNSNSIELYLSKQRVINDVYALASDKMEGRKFPDAGRIIAAHYIAQQFENANLKGINKGTEPYFQKIPVTKIDKGETIIYHKENKLYAGEVFSFASTKPLSDSLSIPVKFVGYSTGELTGYVGKDTLLFFLAFDILDAQIRLKDLAENTGAKYFGFSLYKEKSIRNILAGNEGSSLIASEERLDTDLFYPEGVFNQFTYEKINWLYDYLPDLDKDIALFLFNDDLFEQFFEKSLSEAHPKAFINYKKNTISGFDRKQLNFSTSFKLIKKTKYDDNIIGYIEGTDLKDEVIIICGHYDHLGKDGDNIYYGADDNASGTAAVMELARLFTYGKEQGMDFRRTIVFITFGAEESGLNGSSYYVANPVFPLEKTAMVINLDMIGKSDHPAGKPGYANVLPMRDLRRPTWKAFRNTARKIEDIKLQRIFPSIRNILNYLGSDHYPFFKEGVPAVYINTGLHDDYHEPTDTPDKIDYNNLTNIIKTVFVVAAKVANDPERFPLN